MRDRFRRAIVDEICMGRFRTDLDDLFVRLNRSCGTLSMEQKLND